MHEARSRSLALALGGLIALAAAMGIGRFVYTPILPYMEQALDLSKAEAGVVASANFLGYLLGALGAAAGRLPGGRRPWFLAALGGSAATTAAMGLASAVPVFLVLRFLGGVASAFVLVFGSALVLDRLAQAGRPGLSSLHFAGVGSGIAASALLVWGLAAAGADWRALWLASGALSLLALLAARALVPGEAEAGAVPPAETAAPAGSDRRLPILALAYGLFGFGYVITATFISTMVRSLPEIAALEGLVWLVVGLAAVPSVAFWAWLGRRWGNDRSFALACLVEGIGVALSVLVTGPVAIVVAAALLGGTFMGITALGLINARTLSRGDPRRSIAMMTAAFGLGQMIGPSFAGYAYGFGDSFLLPSLVAAGALVISAALAQSLRLAKNA